MADFEHHEQLAFRALAESRASSLTHTREYHVQVAQVEATLALAAAVAALSRTGEPADRPTGGPAGY